MRTLLFIAATGLLLAGCKDAKPAATRLDAADNGLAEGVATSEGARALKQAIRIGAKRPAPSTHAGASAAAKETCLERHADALAYGKDWATRLPKGFTLPEGARIDEAAGRDGGGCAVRIVSLAAPGTDREAIAGYWERSARGAGYDAGRTVRGNDLIVAGTRDDAAWMVMIGRPKGGSTPVDFVSTQGG